VMFPALRLGYMVVPPALRDTFRAAKWLSDRGCGAIEQVALAKLIASGQFERLLRRTGKLLAERRRALLHGLAKHCAGLVEPHGASSGMHVLVALTRHRMKDVPAIVRLAETVELGVYPADPYYARLPRRGALLLGYSGLSPRDIGEATRRLGDVLSRVPSGG
jgi:GntR family transcriptional regulator / MocR family aminotransferase